MQRFTPRRASVQLLLRREQRRLFTTKIITTVGLTVLVYLVLVGLTV